MAEKINKLYKPTELTAAIYALQNNPFHCLSYEDAKAMVLALHHIGYRLVKVN